MIRNMRGLPFIVAIAITALATAARATDHPQARGEGQGMRIADASGGKVTIDIPQQPLNDSLRALGAQANINIVYDPPIVENRTAPAIQGQVTIQQALTTLLKDTGLSYEYVTDKTVAIRALKPVQTTSLARDGGDEASATNEGEGAGKLRIAQTENQSKTDQESRGSSAGVSPQGDEGKREELEEIVVTGTHIRGTENTTAPVLVLDKAYIDSTGFGTATRLIESLPQNFALASQSGVNVPGVSGSAIQGSGINLRGIGEGTTLTLLNGRRLPLGFLGRAVDISALPLSAVERVEVLTDGASALYGSDAVGGVVNFILRRNFEGAETRLRAGHADGVDEYRVSQAFGNAWESGNAMLGLEYYKRDLLRSSDRDFVPNTSDIASLLPRDKNLSATFAGRQDVSETLEIFAEALYTDRDSYNQSGQVTFSESSTVENPQLATTAGLGWRVGDDWRIEGSGGYGRNKVDQTQASSFGSLITHTVFEIETAQVKADGSLFSLPGGNVRVAAGLDWRSESFGFTQSFGGASVSQDFDQIVRSAFGEVYVPIVGADNARPAIRRLELSVAARLDDYSKFGSSFDPRFGLMWEPVAGLRFRGSHGTSYMAPRLLDYDETFNATSVNTFADPLGGTSRQLWVFGTDVSGLSPQQAESSSFGVEFAPPALTGLQIALNYYKINYRDRIENPPFPGVILDNPSSFGNLIVRNPSTAQVDAAVEVGRSVGRFFDCEFDPVACSPDPNFDPASIAVIVDARRRNLSLMKTSGLDASLQYAFAAAGGQVELGLNGTRIFKIEQQATPRSAPLDTVDTFYNPPNWRARGSMGFERGEWAANLFVNHTDSYTDNRLPTSVPVGSYTTVDARLAYDFNEHIDGFFSGVTVSASAQNLFDRDPPRTAVLFLERDMGFDPTNASPLDRLLAVELTKAW